MSSISIELSSVTKSFNRRPIFTGICASLTLGSVLAVTGKNGAGKSTLLKIIAGLLAPTEGTVVVCKNGAVVARADIHDHLGFVAPYLNLFDEFTGRENLMILRDIRTQTESDIFVDSLLDRMSLFRRRNDLVRTYSSGMKQRLKYAYALLHSPSVLVLDEPRANLDEEGVAIISELIVAQRQRGVVIIGTNEKSDLGLCNEFLDLDTMSTRGIRA